MMTHSPIKQLLPETGEATTDIGPCRGPDFNDAVIGWWTQQPAQSPRKTPICSIIATTVMMATTVSACGGEASEADTSFVAQQASVTPYDVQIASYNPSTETAGPVNERVLRRRTRAGYRVVGFSIEVDQSKFYLVRTLLVNANSGVQGSGLLCSSEGQRTRATKAYVPLVARGSALYISASGVMDVCGWCEDETRNTCLSCELKNSVCTCPSDAGFNVQSASSNCLGFLDTSPTDVSDILRPI